MVYMGLLSNLTHEKIVSPLSKFSGVLAVLDVMRLSRTRVGILW